MGLILGSLVLSSDATHKLIFGQENHLNRMEPLLGNDILLGEKLDQLTALARIPAKWNHFAEKDSRQIICWSKSLSPKSSTLAGFALE